MNETEHEEVPILKRQPHTQGQTKETGQSFTFICLPMLSLNYLQYLRNGKDLSLYF